jgi:hypothetical protein
MRELSRAVSSDWLLFQDELMWDTGILPACPEPESAPEGQDESSVRQPGAESLPAPAQPANENDPIAANLLNSRPGVVAVDHFTKKIAIFKLEQCRPYDGVDRDQAEPEMTLLAPFMVEGAQRLRQQQTPRASARLPSISLAEATEHSPPAPGHGGH